MGAYLRRAEDLGFDCAVVHRPPPAHAARLCLHVARAGGAARGAGRGHAHDAARHHGAGAAAAQSRLLRQGVGDPRCPLGRPRRSSGWASAGTRRSSRLMGVPHKRARPPHGRDARGGDRALGGRSASPTGAQYYAFENLTIDPKPVAEAASADLDRRRHAALGEDLRPDRGQYRSRPARASRSTPGPGCRIPPRPPRW